jgi:hypothetical protein
MVGTFLGFFLGLFFDFEDIISSLPIVVGSRCLLWAHKSVNAHLQILSDVVGNKRAKDKQRLIKHP